MGARGQLRRHPLPDPPGSRRHVHARSTRSGRPTSRRRCARGRRRVPGGDAPGRGHDPHRRARRAPRRPRPRTATTARRRSRRVLERSRGAAHDAVERTPELLPVLKDAGVVDAGGRGFALLLDAFLHVVDGRPLPEPEVVATPPAVAGAPARRDDVSSLRYEVMYLLEADDDDDPRVQGRRGARIGDSIVVVGGDGMWNCHVHTERHRRRDRGGHRGRPAVARSGSPTCSSRSRRSSGCGGDGVVTGRRRRRARRDRGRRGRGRRRAQPPAAAASACSRWSPGGQSMNPSTAQILEAVRALRRPRTCVVLPNNKNIVAGRASRSTA